MASSGNPRQFIQRRGRLLRKSDEREKKHAYIYDILVTAPIPAGNNPEFNLSERKVIAKELLRHKEFAETADNKKDAIKRIKEITKIFKIDFEKLTYDYIRDEMS
jgi:superfamily II DNA or RNA helicase